MTKDPSDSSEMELSTISTYDNVAESWAREHADRQKAGYGTVIDKFKDLLPAGSIVEIGVGGGSDGALLTAEGYHYLGIDASAGMVKVARTSHPDLKFEQCNVYDLADLKQEFDGFWACAVLVHIPRARIDEALQAIGAVVRLGGVGFISLKAGDTEEFEEREKLGRQERRLFTYWHRGDFEQVLQRNHFETLWYQHKPMDQRTEWHWFIVRKEEK